VPCVFWRLVSKSCDECRGSFARGCEAKWWSHWTCSSLGTIFQPMRINSVPDVKCFCNNKNVLRAQSMVWHFVRHPVCECKEDFFQCFMAYVFGLGYWFMILHILETLALLGCSAAQGGTDMLSLNINNQLLAYATQHPRRVKASTTLLQKPVISLHNIPGGYQHLRPDSIFKVEVIRMRCVPIILTELYACWSLEWHAEKMRQSPLQENKTINIKLWESCPFQDHCKQEK